ncbi:MAG: RNA 2',3'-cyclic phosphodiesterase [Lysobacterales bacterium]
MRLFIGAPIPPGEAFSAATRNLERIVPGAQAVPVGSWHVTLRFFGEVDDWREAAMAMQMALGSLVPVSARVCGVGAFPNPHRARIAWAAVDAPGLIEVEQRIRQATAGIGNPPDQRAFAPHVTLARLSHPGNLESWTEAQQDTLFFEGELAQIVLFRSDLTGGVPVYTPQSVMSLG